MLYYIQYMYVIHNYWVYGIFSLRDYWQAFIVYTVQQLCTLLLCTPPVLDGHRPVVRRQSSLPISLSLVCHRPTCSLCPYEATVFSLYVCEKRSFLLKKCFLCVSCNFLIFSPLVGLLHSKVVRSPSSSSVRP